MDFVVSTHSMMNATAKYADIILPARDWMWEEKILPQSQYGGFESINFCPEVVPPPGEVKAWVWMYTKMAEKLGVDPRKYFQYYTTDENWEKNWEKYLKDTKTLKKTTIRKEARKYPPGKILPGVNLLIAMRWIHPLCPLPAGMMQIKEGNPLKPSPAKLSFIPVYGK